MSATCALCRAAWGPDNRRDAGHPAGALARWYYRGDDRRVCWFCLRRAVRRLDITTRKAA